MTGNNRKKMVGVFAVALLLGLTACIDTGSSNRSSSSDDGDYTALDERPAPASTEVGESTARLSSSINVGGAARVSGDIPSGELSRSGSKVRIASKSATESKLETLGRAAPRVANTTENYNLVQGAWSYVQTDTPFGYVVDGNQVYGVGTEPCWSTPAGTTTDFLEDLLGVSENFIIDGDGDTLYRSTTGVMEACVDGSGGDSSGGAITSGTGQVIFSDNSTFAYSFSTTAVPTAVFIQLIGAQEYFVVPARALISNGAGSYTINFFGPTPSASVQQVINQLLNGEILIQAFFGQATEAELLNGTFPGSSTASNWSAPTYVDCVARPVSSGELQFSLTWDAVTDLDLHVIEPSGNRIYFGSRISASGGQLDFDNTHGYGPENIFWETTPPAGTYTAYVRNYNGRAASNYTLTVTKRGVVTTHTGWLDAVSGQDSEHITVTMP